MDSRDRVRRVTLRQPRSHYVLADMRFVWLVLNDGRSMVARCAAATRERLESALADPARCLEFTTPQGVDTVPAAAVRDFVVFDAKSCYETGRSIDRQLHL